MVMIPKIMTIVADCYGNSEKLKKLRKHQFIRFLSPNDISNSSSGFTLIYGYSIAKQLYKNISIGDYFIDENTRWTFNEFESKDDNYIDEWIAKTLDIFFEYEPVQGAYGSKLIEQLNATELVFLYNGNHELYLYDSAKKQCYSWTHEEIEYRLDIEPEAFACIISNHLFAQKRAVYAWDPFNLKTVNYKYDHILVFIRDIAYASIGQWLTKKEIQDMIGTHRKITTPEFMKYLSHMPSIYQNMEQKDYLRRFMAGEVEQLYSNAKICFDNDKLLAAIKQRNKSNGDARPMEKIYNALDSDGMVQIPYMSRNKVTGRMFPNGGIFNPITLSDPDILSCIKSRHNGTIVSFDFSMFEPTIILHILKIPVTNDIHQRAAEILDCSRDAAKTINNMILYGSSERSITIKMNSLKITLDAKTKYLQMMKPIMDAIAELTKLLTAHYEKFGYIKNALGRIVRPKSKSAIFNNYIQSTAADLFNSTSSHVFDLLQDIKSCLFMHKFDAIYVDVHPEETDILEKIIHIMANKMGILFKVSVLAGKNLGNLKVLQ